jgi:hypothetical protein
MFNPDPNSRLNRIVFAVLGLVALGFGVSALQRIGFGYHNWWGGSVFGPSAIVFGILFVAAMFKLGSAKRENPGTSKRTKEKRSFHSPPWRHS